MIAQLKIYSDCSSVEPTKTYDMLRTTTKVTKRMADFQTRYDKVNPTDADYDEVMADLDDLIKTIFPSITDEELEDASIEDKLEFVWSVVRHFNKVAVKN